jgi:hypothetical protein
MPESQTMLARALAKAPARRTLHATDEEIELALAWLQDRVTLTQVVFALYGAGEVVKRSYGGNALYRVAVSLREAHRQGKLKVVA